LVGTGGRSVWSLDTTAAAQPPAKTPARKKKP
jgi:hypothetical protein